MYAAIPAMTIMTTTIPATISSVALLELVVADVAVVAEVVIEVVAEVLIVPVDVGSEVVVLVEEPVPTGCRTLNMVVLN